MYSLEPTNFFQSFVQRIADDVKNWSCLLIFGEISEVNVYLPTIQYVYGKEFADFDLFISQSLQNNARHESPFGIFQFYVKSIKMKCDVVSGVSEMLNSTSFITVSKNGGSASMPFYTYYKLPVCMVKLE